MSSEHKSELTYYNVGFSVLCACILMLSYLYVMHTTSKHKQTRDAMEHTLLAVKEQQVNLSGQHQQLAKSVAELESTTAQHNSLLPLSYLNERSADIVSLAEDNQMQVDSFSPGQKDTNADIAYQSFLLQGVATFDQLNGFLKAVAEQMHDIHIVDIKLTNTERLSDKLAIELQMKWYIRRDD